MSHPISKSLFVLLAFVWQSIPARAEKDFQSEVGRIAEDVRDQLKEQKEKAIALGSFTGPEEYNAEAQIRLTLVRALADLKVRIDAEARLRLSGRYTPLRLIDTGRAGVELKVVIEDRRRDRVLVELRARLITVMGDVARVVGWTGTLSPAATEEERNGEVLRSIETPRAHLQGSVVLAGPDSPFGVELSVRKKSGKYEPRRAEDHKGLPFVRLLRDEVYAIRLINRSKHETMVRLTIDGLSAFAFSDRCLDEPAFLIPPGKSLMVRGWPLNPKKSAEFKATRYADSALNELAGDRAKVGVIVATFAAAWPKGGMPPGDEASKSIATGRSAEIATPFEIVERHVGRVRAAVSIRYTR